MPRRSRGRTRRRLRAAGALAILGGAAADEVAGLMRQTDTTVGWHICAPKACYFRPVLLGRCDAAPILMRRSMTYARLSVAVRVSKAMTVALGIIPLTATTGSAET